MALQRQPTKIAGDGRHYGPGTRRFTGDTTGPAQQVPRINVAAQSGRENQISRGVTGSTNARQISRDGLTPSNLDNYGAGD